MQSTRSGLASRRGAKARDQNSEARVVFRQQFRKTELCRFYQSGCVKGSNCCFAHGESELRIAPDLTKTSLCQDWIDRRCPLTAEACQFAHGWSDMNTTPAFVEYGARQSKKSASSTTSCCEVSSSKGEIGSMVETPQPPSKPRNEQKRATRRSATAKPGLQTSCDTNLSSGGSSQGSPTMQSAAFDVRAAGQPAMFVGQPEKDGIHMAIMLQPLGAMPAEMPLLSLQLTAAGILQPQLPHPLPDNQAMEVLLRQAMPDHYDD
mmetsp:Transcript_120285/g.351480  ORF Transcript_120285/g.351480 Transcript_120285/m.351480 type:complete len:263 (-) Transcript_120285:379-1167(-)